MNKEGYQPFDFQSQSFSLGNQLNNTQNNEPFKILYNARSTKTGKSRKSSVSIFNQTLMRTKKPRKMTLPLMEHKTAQQFEEIIYEAFSENNLLQSYSYEENEQFYVNNKQKITIEQIDLQRAIQFGLAEESDLDRESWFQLRNQNPEFPLN